MSLGGIGKNEIVLSDTAFQLGLEVVTVVGVAVVTNPHLGHPFDVVLYHVCLWQRAVPYILVFSSKAALALQLEVQLAIFHVVAHRFAVGLARVWILYVVTLRVLFFGLGNLDLIDGDTLGNVGVLLVSKSYT